MMEAKVDVVVTGIDWMGSGVGSIESAMRKFFQGAKREVILTAYTITDGTDIIWECLEKALSRGVEIKLLINRLDLQSQKTIAILKNLAHIYPHFHLYNFASSENIDLHAKLLVIDRQKAIVGSSNLSRRGFLTNYELALTVEGKVAAKIAGIVDRLISESERYGNSSTSVTNPQGT